MGWKHHPTKKHHFGGRNMFKLSKNQVENLQGEHFVGVLSQGMFLAVLF